MRHRILLMIAGLLVLGSGVVFAQVKAGEAELSGLSGVLSAGYTGSFGNLETSSHSLDFGGAASLNGYYHNPNFLSFNLSPFYNQSRANSDSQSITDSSGFSASTGLFTGSSFPGSVSYSREYDSTGLLSLPGQANYTTYGNNDNLGVNWGFNFHRLPSITLYYLLGHNDYSVFGAQGDGRSAYQQGGIRATYLLAGFNLNAGYSRGDTEATFPQVFEIQSLTSNSQNQAFNFGASHRLPWSGGASVGFTRSDFSSLSGQQLSASGTVDTVYATVNLQPTSKLTLLTTSNYTDNLQGLLNQAILSAGGVLQNGLIGYGGHSLDIASSANYVLTHNLTLGAQADRQQQSSSGVTYGSTSIGGSAMYLCRCLGGSVSAALTVFDLMNDTRPGSSIGLNSSTSYSRSIGAWDVLSSVSYSQNAQTVLVGYLTSYLNYNGTVSRRIRRLMWYGSVGGGNSVLVQQPGTSSNSQNFSTGLSGRRFSGSINYGRASGNGIQTIGGITPVPVPSPILPSTSLIAYGGKSYGFSVASTPVPRFLVSFSYSKSINSTISDLSGSRNDSLVMTARLQYQLRKITAIAGYTRLRQGFSLTPGPPVDTSTFYAGISRAFRFF